MASFWIHSPGNLIPALEIAVARFYLEMYQTSGDLNPVSSMFWIECRQDLRSITVGFYGTTIDYQYIHDIRFNFSIIIRK
jgi:hypothetical protein